MVHLFLNFVWNGINPVSINRQLSELATRAGFVVKKPELLLELLFPKSSKGQDQERVTKKDKGPLNSLEHRLRIMREGGVELPDSFVLMARVLISLGGLMNQHHVKLTAQELVAMLMKQQND